MLPITLGFAAAASAAFPFGLPPLSIPASAFRDAPLIGQLAGHRKLVLTDGGVLENLGVQTLLRSSQFGARHIIVSDAGTKERSWQPSVLGNLKNFAAFALTAETLSQLVSVMNSKENRSMREIAMYEVGAIVPPARGRRVLFVRIDQNWDHFILGIPHTRLRELAGGNEPPTNPSVQTLEEFLATTGVDLAQAKELFTSMRGSEGVARANAVGTNFTGLSQEECSVLDLHAQWQVHAAHAVYGPLPFD